MKNRRTHTAFATGSSSHDADDRRGKQRFGRIPTFLLGYLFGVLCDRGLNLKTTQTKTAPWHNFREAPKIGCSKSRSLPPIRTRDEIGSILENEGFRRGAEVGVQNGLNARELLQRWSNAEYLALVDLWAHQNNYADIANVDDAAHETALEATRTNLKEWTDKLEYFRMLSTEAAAQMDDQSLDFIYIDARHDYCGVTEDLEAFWPKLRPGGIMAGHDFKYASEVAPHQDWTLCRNGTVHNGAVRGAVEDFVTVYRLQLIVGYGDEWPSWMLRKPFLCAYP